MIFLTTLRKKRKTPYHWTQLWEKLPIMPGFNKKPYLNRKQGYEEVIKFFVYDEEHVFICYGDMTINDGNTDLVSLNPATREYTTHRQALPTEAIRNMFKFDGVLYIPYSDPIGYYEETVPYITWPEQSNVGTGNWAHVTSIEKHENKIWVFGSMIKEKEGSIKELASASWSSDEGSTWNHYIFPENENDPYSEIIYSFVSDYTNELFIQSAGFKWYKLVNMLWEEVSGSTVPARNKIDQEFYDLAVSPEMRLITRVGQYWVSTIPPEFGTPESAEIWVSGPKQ